MMIYTGPVPRKCSRCGFISWTPTQDFHKAPRNKDGYRGICKTCTNDDSKRYRENYKKIYSIMKYGLQGDDLMQLVNRQIHHLNEIGSSPR